MTLYVVPIVEGQTEQGCVERLLNRVWYELLGQSEPLRVIEPFRGHRDDLVHTNELKLTETVEKASLKLMSKSRSDSQARRWVLILLDAENDCPKDLAPHLLAVARRTIPAAIPVSCVLAKKMLENWIVAGASTLAGVNGLPDPLPARDQFEDRSGVAWLETQLRSRNRSRKYKKTDDAKRLVDKMDLQECRVNSPSFDKLCREFEARLPQPIDPPEPTADTDPLTRPDDS
ncbi:DUF4276 family protein [Fimbriiglobus ruber]|uniref:DUF4276 family protein n=1 Tax=Fimbriiglobus ruber TaxID=1908690 RepID=A0A225DHE4_9BACT|nr:DUF4276 family protein [Fimbriiglobus ruber]OWK35805.1 hypothetical protein FRUB_08368 [Fimbriiglobus ruber]